MGDGRDADIRIGDLERGQATAMLDIHLGHGRLSAAEHEERCAMVAAARTRGDIESLFDDLPAPHPDLSEATRSWPAHQVAPVHSTRPARSTKAVPTPRSEALGIAGGVWLVTMLPTAIVLTVYTNAWWMFIVFVVGLMVIGGMSESSKKAPPEA